MKKNRKKKEKSELGQLLASYVSHLKAYLELQLFVHLSQQRCESEDVYISFHVSLNLVCKFLLLFSSKFIYPLFLSTFS